jgi:2'-5' RNA ligase
MVGILEVIMKKVGKWIRVMLDLDGSKIEDHIDPQNLYFSKDKQKFWIKGFVAGKVPHVTLLYGLLKSATLYKKYIDQVLTGWELKSVTVDKIGCFESSFKDEPYYCIVAEVEVDPDLQEGHERLQFLPHIDTFTGYKPHMTIAYIKKDEETKKRIMRLYEKLLVGEELKVTGLNYGGNKE